MVVIGVGYLSYFFPILKDPLVLTLTCVVVLWIFVLLNIVGPKMITRVQAVATVLALVPIVGIAVFGWFWFRGETYMAARNVSGMNTFGAIQSTLNVTLWSFIGVESASVAAGVVKNPKRNVPIATIGGVLIAAVCYVLSTTAIMGMIPNAALRVSASPFGDAARMALGDTAGAIVSFCAAAGCLGSLGGWTLLAGQTAKAAADDGLFPPIFARVNSRYPGGRVNYRRYPDDHFPVQQHVAERRKRVWSGLFGFGHLHAGAISVHLRCAAAARSWSLRQSTPAVSGGDLYRLCLLHLGSDRFWRQRGDVVVRHADDYYRAVRT